MIFTRKIGSILRGNVTPFQLASGCILGSLLGFIPSAATAPGIFLATAFLLVLLNANLFLAALVGALTKALSLLLLPVSFTFGQWLLDGPMAGIFEALINAPVWALFGFENYAVTGGLVMGILVGSALAWLTVTGIQRFRRRMANMSQNSTRYKEWNERTWVRWAVFILVGGGLKKPDYEKLTEKRMGNPVRPLGIAFVGVSLVFLVVAYKFFAPSIVTTALRDGLERANGATVDLESADLDLGSGSLVMTGLAMADPQQLDTNLFMADRIEANVSGADLLRKRLTIDNLVVTGGALAQPRRVAGRPTGEKADPAEGPGIVIPDAETLEKYFNNAQVWRERLAQVQSWLDRLGGNGPAGDGNASGPDQNDPDWNQRMERIAQQRGYDNVSAEHLITSTPTLTVLRFEADNVISTWLPEETLQIEARNVSTQPWLLADKPEITITSSGGTAAAAVKGSADRTEISAHYHGMPTAHISDSLKGAGGSTLLQGGTIDFELAGAYNFGDGTMAFPVEIELHDTTVQLAGKAVPLDNFKLPVKLAGSFSNPAISVESSQLQQIAKQAGARLIRDKVEESVGDKAGKLLGNLLGGSKDKPDEEESE